MKKSLIIAILTSAFTLSMHAGDEQSKKLKELSDCVNVTNLCAARLMGVEIRSKKDTPNDKKKLDDTELRYRQDFCAAAQKELKLRDEIRSKWPLYPKIDEILSQRVSAAQQRAKL